MKVSLDESMVLPLKKVMIVPDFGVSAEDEAMVALKDAIETDWRYEAKVVDLPTIVRAEHKGEKLSEAKVIELSAAKLVELSECEKLLKAGSPSTIVVFGKSAMLTGDLDPLKRLLFINPKYDREVPWTKQYYIDKRTKQRPVPEFINEYEHYRMPTVDSTGREYSNERRYTNRFYGIVTSDQAEFNTFWDKYPRMVEFAPELDGNTPDLATFIREFADKKVSYPLLEVYDAIKCLPGRYKSNKKEICTFSEPVKLNNMTVYGIVAGVPYANGQSIYKLKLAENEKSCMTPLEAIETRNELNILRDAIMRESERLSSHKRILIVPDFFTPYDAPNIGELYDCLKQMGHYVAVFDSCKSLETSRNGLEHRCRVKPFDLIVTIETGCLLATRITNSPRVFVNPNWTVWEELQEALYKGRLPYVLRRNADSDEVNEYLCDKDEVYVAREMAAPSTIRHDGKPVYSWFSQDAIHSDLGEAHLKRFESYCCIGTLDLMANSGIVDLATRIDDLLKD